VVPLDDALLAAAIWLGLTTICLVAAGRRPLGLRWRWIGTLLMVAPKSQETKRQTCPAT